MVERARVAAGLFAVGYEVFAVGRELLGAVVAPVGDVDVAVVVHADAPGLVELAGAAAAAAKSEQEFAVVGELEGLVGGCVGYVDVAVVVAGYAGGADELALAVPFAGALAVGVIDFDLLFELVCAVDIAVIVNGDAHRPDEFFAGEVADKVFGDGNFADALVGGLDAARALLASAEDVDDAAGGYRHVGGLGKAVAGGGVAAYGVAEVPGSAGYGGCEHKVTSDSLRVIAPRRRRAGQARRGWLVLDMPALRLSGRWFGRKRAFRIGR